MINNAPGELLTKRRGSWVQRLVGRESPLRRLDWVLVFAVVVLSLFGALLVWSSTRAVQLENGGDPLEYAKKHLAFTLIGLVLGGVVATLDYRLVRAYAPILFAASCLGLVAVLTPLGATIKGSHSWIELGGGLQLQPSEFAKVGLIVLLAMLLGEPRDGEIGPGRRDVLVALGLAALPIGLVLAQPDLGTALVFAALVLGMLAISGIPKRSLVGLVAGGVVVVVLAWMLGLLQPHQVARITAFADPSADPDGAGYNAQQARIAVGSGGFLGKGLFNGQQTSGHFVPEQHTDFIFTAAGEELGFLGASVILALLGLVLWRGLRIAQRCEDMFGALMATGVVCWLAFQTFENVGMTVGIMPITGLPLPFVSYGGSATLATMIGLGLLQAVHLRRNTYD